MACSIELPEMFILTGGADTRYDTLALTTVSRYSTSGWMEDLPELNEGRRNHGCGYFFNDDMQTVSSIRHSNSKKIIFPPIKKEKKKIMAMYKNNLFL